MIGLVLHAYKLSVLNNPIMFLSQHIIQSSKLCCFLLPTAVSSFFTHNYDQVSYFTEKIERARRDLQYPFINVPISLPTIVTLHSSLLLLDWKKASPSICVQNSIPFVYS